MASCLLKFPDELLLEVIKYTRPADDFSLALACSRLHRILKTSLDEHEKLHKRFMLVWQNDDGPSTLHLVPRTSRMLENQPWTQGLPWLEEQSWSSMNELIFWEANGLCYEFENFTPSIRILHIHNELFGAIWIDWLFSNIQVEELYIDLPRCHPTQAPAYGLANGLKRLSLHSLKRIRVSEPELFRSLSEELDEMYWSESSDTVPSTACELPVLSDFTCLEHISYFWESVVVNGSELADRMAKSLKSIKLKRLTMDELTEVEDFCERAASVLPSLDEILMCFELGPEHSIPESRVDVYSNFSRLQHLIEKLNSTDQWTTGHASPSRVVCYNQRKTISIHCWRVVVWTTED